MSASTMILSCAFIMLLPVGKAISPNFVPLRSSPGVAFAFFNEVHIVKERWNIITSVPVDMILSWHGRLFQAVAQINQTAGRQPLYANFPMEFEKVQSYMKNFSESHKIVEQALKTFALDLQEGGVSVLAPSTSFATQNPSNVLLQLHSMRKAGFSAVPSNNSHVFLVENELRDLIGSVETKVNIVTFISSDTKIRQSREDKLRQDDDQIAWAIREFISMAENCSTVYRTTIQLITRQQYFRMLHHIKVALKQISQSSGAGFTFDLNNITPSSFPSVAPIRFCRYDGKLIVESEVAVIDNSVFELYRLMPFPTFLNNQKRNRTVAYIQPKNDYLLINRINGHHTFLGYSAIDACYDINRIVVCDFEELEFIGNSCENDLLNADKDMFPESCDVQIQHSFGDLITPAINSCKWIYSLRDSKLAQIQCDQYHFEMPVFGAGIIELPLGCSLNISNKIVSRHDDGFCNKPVFIPNVNMSLNGFEITLKQQPNTNMSFDTSTFNKSTSEPTLKILLYVSLFLLSVLLAGTIFLFVWAWKYYRNGNQVRHGSRSSGTFTSALDTQVHMPIHWEAPSTESSGRHVQISSTSTEYDYVPMMPLARNREVNFYSPYATPRSPPQRVVERCLSLPRYATPRAPIRRETIYETALSRPISSSCPQELNSITEKLRDLPLEEQIERLSERAQRAERLARSIRSKYNLFGFSQSSDIDAV